MEGRNDCDFKFMEQKGLAQRNGRVTGHLALHAKNKSCANVTPKGSAQLLIASDLFDAPSALAYLAADGEAVCERVYQVPLTLMLAKAGIEEMPASQIIQTLQNKIGERGSFLNAKEIVQGLLGKTIYAPTMLLGAAFQRGLLPFSLAAMEAAIASAIKHKHEVEQNLSAFHVGRWWVAFGESHLRQQFQLPEKNATPLATWRQSLQAAYLPWQGRNRMLQQFDQALEKLQKNCSWLETAYAAQYLHDCLVYKGNTDLIALVDEIISATQQLPDEKNKKMWARIFVKTHFVKDEVFVAHQMISPIKVVQDQQLYQAMGKKYSIERMNRPSFQLFGFKLEMDISPSDWMLKIMRHMRWLRLVMPSWHQRERAMATAMQTQLRQLLQQPDQTLVGKKLQALDAIKGYREVRYQKWQELMEQA
jgi:indolepyruvate ferredoxin oxidoreductase